MCSVACLAIGSPAVAHADEPASPTASEDAPAAPRSRSSHDPLVPDDVYGIFYTRAGYGASPATAAEMYTRKGLTIGFGYRRAVGRWLLDISVANLQQWHVQSATGNISRMNVLAAARVAALRVVPRGSSAFYFGGGLSYGESEVDTAGINTDGSKYGAQLDAAAGWETMRDASVRVFVELDLIMPLVRVDGIEDVNVTPMVARHFWAPFVGASIGFGIDLSPTDRRPKRGLSGAKTVGVVLATFVGVAVAAIVANLGEDRPDY